MPESSQTAGFGTCPDCGAALLAGATACPKCDWKKTPAGETPAEATAKPADGSPFDAATTEQIDETSTPAERRAGYQFSLASLLIVMALAAVILSIGVVLPGLGIALALLVAPALVLTNITAMRSLAKGHPLSRSDKLSLFAAALGAILLTLIATGIAFFATCAVGFFGGSFASGLFKLGGGGYATITWGAATGSILGGIVGLIVFGLIFRRLVRVFSRRTPAK